MKPPVHVWLCLILWTVATLFLGSTAHANTPGKVTVSLTWNSTCTGCTFNVYRAAATGVCSGTPTPYATGITNLSYIDLNVSAGQSYFYAVTAVKGVESACSNEAQVSVPTIPPPPTSLQATSP